MKNIILFLAILSVAISYSQDIRGGYIHTGRTSGTTYSIGIVLYIDAAQSLARPAVTVSFGDNTTGTFSLSSSSTSGNLTTKTYTGSHTYPGFGQYLVNYLDNFRIAGIINMQNSSTQQIGLTAVVNLSSFVISNCDPIFAIPPTGLAFGFTTLSYNPGFNSPAGDSLSYLLENCLGSGYYAASGASLSPTSGMFTFSNDTTGIYAFRYTVKVWRKNPQNSSYVQIGSTQMEFLVDVVGPVGIEEYSSSFRVKVFPNPIVNNMHLNFEATGSLPKSMIIVNTLGQKVFETSTVVHEVDMSTTASGVYYLNLFFENSPQQVVKLVKQ